MGLVTILDCRVRDCRLPDQGWYRPMHIVASLETWSDPLPVAVIALRVLPHGAALIHQRVSCSGNNQRDGVSGT